MVFNGLQPCQ